jgi:hypothetical protein
MLTVIEHIRGAKNVHPKVRCRCACGQERIVRTTDLRRGRVDRCAGCARAAGARQGAEKRRLPPVVAWRNQAHGVYLGNAVRKGVVFDLTREQFGGLVFAPCAYCGATPAGGVDRAINTEGYTPNNTVPCCSTCNYAKRDLTVAEFLGWAKRIHEHQSLLQRDRSVLLRLVEQPDGRRPDHAREDL